VKFASPLVGFVGSKLGLQDANTSKEAPNK
jgi:hypothetical protein